MKCKIPSVARTKFWKNGYLLSLKMNFPEVGFQMLRVKRESRAQRGQNLEKYVFLSPEKSNCEISKTKWWVFSGLGIKFNVNVIKLSSFSPLGGGNYSLLSLPQVRHWYPFTLALFGYIYISISHQNLSFQSPPHTPQQKHFQLAQM